VSAACIIFGWVAIAFAAFALFHAVSSLQSGTYDAINGVSMMVQFGIAVMLGASGVVLLLIGEMTRVFVWIEYNTAQATSILQAQFAPKSDS
jgi:nucleoside recognition membrane protein YjiH